jgi:N6-L-threonylcarbamoyladenine synthase
MKKSVVILAIETSCDETAAAVLEIKPSPQPSPRGRGSKTVLPQIKTLSSVVKSQISIHKSFGGVVPEAAARAHVKNILPVVKKALADSDIADFDGRQNQQSTNLNSIDFIAVTAGPGLIPSLIVGVEFAKALSLATVKPIIPVNHMLGHLYSPFKTLTPNPSPKGRGEQKIFPMISLIVSGGHTILTLMKNIDDYKVLGQTVDDAAGEAFDKVAKMLNLPYPGGPEVSRLAEKSKSPVQFPRPMINSKNYDFSFSGLKTAVLYYLRDTVGEGLKPSPTKTKNICAGFQQAAVDVLVTKTLRAVKEYGAKSVSLSGGVAANKALRDALNLKSKIFNLKFFVPPQNLCTDNAEMIGIAACFMLHNGFKPVSYKKVKANSNLEL